ncbi:MAG: enoyl-CoA hydratase/isomerase family protein [Acidobacteriota bacterium]
MPLTGKSPEALAFKEVLYEKKDWIARITINRPERYNAYSTPALIELATAFRDAAFDDSVAVVVYTGAGKSAFCTGGDVKEYQAEYTSRPRDYWKYMGLFKEYIESILNCGKPTIARLNGMAVGGGNESQLACDLTVMAEHAYVGQVGTSVGSVACGGATQWLPMVVGDKRAREMLYLNPRINAYQALDWGLVNRVVPSVKKDGAFVQRASKEQIDKAQKDQDGYTIDLSALDEEVNKMAQQIVEKFAECTRYTKEQANFWKNLSWYQTVGHARDWLSIHYCALEPWEGMSAFVEKRKARYVGLRERARDDKSSEFLFGAYTKNCTACGAKGIPEHFGFCGMCGARIG